MPQEQNIRSEEVQEILSKAPHWIIIWSNTLILLMLILFILLSYYISYPDIISAESTITSSTPPQKEYAQITGKIDSLLVKNNEIVGTNQVLAVIENTARFNDVQFLKTILDTLSIQGANFEFPIENMPLLSLGEITTAYALFEKDYIDYSLNKSLDPYSNTARANNLSEKELKLRLKSLENQKEIDYKKFDLTKKEYLRNKALYEKGVLSLNEFETRKIKYLEGEKQIKNLEITFSQLYQSIHDAQKNTREAKINNKIESTRLFKTLIQSFTQLIQAIKDWELKYVLTSNIAGKVSFINIWSENQIIKNGDLLFTVVPDKNQNFIAKIKAPIRNSGKIRIGQKVNIKLYNFPETEYGMLNATVQSMSAIPDEEGFYLVNASMQSKLITSYGIEIPFKNEMTGTAEIVTEDLRLLERFFHQIKGIFN